MAECAYNQDVATVVRLNWKAGDLDGFERGHRRSRRRDKQSWYGTGGYDSLGQCVQYVSVKMSVFRNFSFVLERRGGRIT